MCIGDLCLVCVGCRRDKVVVRKPDGLREAPDRILCMSCGYIERGVYVADADGCSICFIPCPCRCNRGDPVLACGRCHTAFSNISLDRCPSCGVYSSIAAKYCASCGAGLQSQSGGGGSQNELGNGDNNGAPGENNGKTVKDMRNSNPQ